MRLKWLAKIIFKLSGWKLGSEFPHQIKKGVVIAAPHTSNWDFVFAMAGLTLMGVPINYTIKKEWLSTPIGPFLKWLGAIPIDRSAAGRRGKASMVDQMIKIMQDSDHIFLMITPEGTRSYVKRWRSGFYHVAFNANVPLLLGYLDYGKKEAGVGPVIYPSGDMDADIVTIKDFYKKVTPRYPEKGVR